MSLLALDIGGTKLMAALVEGGNVLEARRIATDRAAGPTGWLDAAHELCGDWIGRFDRMGIAVTGLVDKQGRWSALNRATLDIPPGTPLTEMAQARFGVPAQALNDAQAAAWAEHRFGAGVGHDLVFLTISTGIGGGAVLGGRLLSGRSGLAGHFGQIRGGADSRLESRVAGRWLAEAAAKSGHAADASAVFEAARRGEDWADSLRRACLTQVAALCRDVQLTFDPDLIVIGGGIGLSEGFLPDLCAHLAELAPVLRPELVATRLGAEAGVIGAADIAAQAGSTI